MPSEAPFRDEELLRQWLDQLLEAVIEVDEGGYLSFANQAAQRLLGYSPEELRGIDLLQLIVPEDRPLVQGYLRRAQEEAAGPAECIFLRKEGNRFPATLSLHPVREEGQPPTLRGILMDLTQFRQAQEALREQEERFRLYFERASDVLFSLSPDLKILSLSPSVERVLGYRPEELMGQHFPELNLLPPASLERARSDIQRVLRGEQLEAVVYEFIAKDGSSRFGEVSSSALFSPEGSPIAIFSVARDITDRMRAEEARRQAEERLRALFEHTPVGMAVSDLEGTILSSNPTYCRFLGYSPGEMEGIGLSDYTYPADLEETRRRYLTLAQGEQDSCLIDQRFVRKRGEVIWGRLSLSLVRDQEGRPQFAIQVCEDITDRRRAEEAMREGEARYRAIMEQASDGIYLVDGENLQILEANSAFLEMLGYTYPEILDLPPSELVRADREELERELSQLLSGKGPLSLERTYRRKDGSLLAVWITAQAITFAGRRAILYLVRDLTERKRRERELREQEEMLTTVLDSLEAHIYVADLESHEILFLNRRMKESFGQEALGQKCYSVFRGESGPCPGCTNQQLLDDQGQPGEMVVWEGRNPITGRWYLNHDRALRWIDGRLARLQVALDITARKQAEEALREDQERYRAIMEQASDGIYLVDRQTRRIIECNPSFAQMLGYTPAEIAGLTIYDLIAAEREDIDRRFQGMVESGGTISLERNLRRKDGSLVPVWIRGQIIAYGGRAVNLSFATDLSERKQAEEALRESEERYRAVVDQAGEAIFLVDPDTRCVLETNPAAQMLLGYSPAELQGMPLYRFIAAEPEDIERRLGHLATLPAGESQSFERILRRKDGTVVPVWVSGSSLRYRGKRLVSVLVRDLSERKQAEQALRESEERYRSLVEWCPDGIYVVDVQTKRLLQSNPAFQHLLGYSAEEISGMHLYDFIAAEQEDIDRRFGRLIGQGLGASFQHEREYRRKDGTLVPVWVTGNVISWGGGQVVFTFVRDLSERRKAERELRESESRYRAIMEQSADGIYLVDPDNRRIIEANRALQRLLGFSAEELAGMSLYDLIEAEREDIAARFQSILDLAPGEIFSLEREYRRKDGTLVPVWVTAAPFYYAGRKAVSVLVRDLTERKQAEREQQRLIQELQEALASIKTLRGLIPICANCKKIRDDQGYWQQVETYVREHSQATFTHGLCPDCARLLFPGVSKERRDDDGAK